MARQLPLRIPMITLSLPGLIFLYVMLFLGVIFLIWVACEMVRKIREHRALQYRLQCTICGMIYEDRSAAVLPRCPRCRSLNERLKVKAY
jgi:hypothetical protein